MRVELSGDLTVGNLANARELLIDAFGKAKEVSIDLGGVTSFDPALLQLLISAGISASASGVKLTFPAMPNAELVRTANDLGIQRPEGAGEDWPW